MVDKSFSFSQLYVPELIKILGQLDPLDLLASPVTPRTSDEGQGKYP